MAGGSHWRPPLRSNCFRIRSTTGWYIWDPGRYPADSGMFRLRRPSEAEESQRRIHRVGTMFWDPYAHNYLHIPLDVTKNDVDSSENYWQYPSFGFRQSTGQDVIAVIRHFGEYKQLPRPGPESWFEKLLPIVFHPPIDPPSPPFSKLAGELDILIALIAFSTTPQNTPQAVDCLFRPDPRTTRFNPDWDLPINRRKAGFHQFRLF